MISQPGEYRNFLSSNKDNILKELDKKYRCGLGAPEISDSFIIRRLKNGVVIKIPVKKCSEEVAILKLFSSLNLTTPEIINTGKILIKGVNVHYYTMREIEDADNILDYNNKYLNNDYYTFLKNLLLKFRQIKSEYFGSASLSGDNKLRAENISDAELLLATIAKAEKSGFWEQRQIKTVIDEVTCFPGYLKESVLVHGDILKNVLFSKKTKNFYIIDPQTTTTFANEYWDLASYLLHANAYGCTRGLLAFFNEIRVRDRYKFLLTAKIIAMERIPFFSNYDRSRGLIMETFLKHLNSDCIMLGDVILKI